MSVEKQSSRHSSMPWGQHNSTPEANNDEMIMTKPFKYQQQECYGPSPTRSPVTGSDFKGRAYLEAELREYEDRMEYYMKELQDARKQRDDADDLRISLAECESTVLQLQAALDARQRCPHCNPSKEFDGDATVTDLEQGIPRKPAAASKDTATMFKSLVSLHNPMTRPVSPLAPSSSYLSPLPTTNLAVRTPASTAQKGLVQGLDYPFSPLPTPQPCRSSPAALKPMQSLAAGNLTPVHINKRALQTLTNTVSSASRTPVGAQTAGRGIENTCPFQSPFEKTQTQQTKPQNLLMQPRSALATTPVNVKNSCQSSKPLTQTAMPQVSTVGFDITASTPAKLVSTGDSTQDASPGTPPTVAAPPPSAIKRATARSSTYSADLSSPSSGFGASHCSPGMRHSSPVSASKMHRLSSSTTSITQSEAPKARKTAFPGVTKLRLKLPTTPSDKPDTSSSSYGALSSPEATTFQPLELAADTSAAARELVTRDSGFAGIRRLDLKLPATSDSSNGTYKVQASRPFNLFPRSGLVVNTAASPATPASSAKYSPDSYSRGRNSTGFPRRGLVVNTAVSSPASSCCPSDSSARTLPSTAAWTVGTRANRLAASNAITAVQSHEVRHTADISAEPWAVPSPVQLSHAAAWRRHQSSALQTDTSMSCHSLGSSPSADKDLNIAEMCRERPATTTSPPKPSSGLKAAMAGIFGRFRTSKNKTAAALSAVLPASGSRCSVTQAEASPASPLHTMPDAASPARCSAAVTKRAAKGTSSSALQAAPAKPHSAPRRSARLAKVDSTTAVMQDSRQANLPSAISHSSRQATVFQGKSDNRRLQSAAIKRSTAVKGSTRQADCKAASSSAPAQPPVLARKTTCQATREANALDKRTRANSTMSCSVASKTMSGEAAVAKPASAASQRMLTRSAAASKASLPVKQSAASGKIEMAAKPSTSNILKIVPHAAAPTATAKTQSKSSGVGRTAAGIAPSQPTVKPRWA